MKKFILAVLLSVVMVIPSIANAMDVTLAWDPNSETDLAGYRLFYKTTAFVSTDPIPAAGTTGWTIVDIPLASLANRSLPEKAVVGLPNVQHWFALTAYDSETPSLQSLFSNVVMVTPPAAPPVVTTHPANIAVNVGGTAAFTVVATGTGLTYQWQSRANATGTWANITGATNATYTTPATVIADDGKQFRCNITNTGGTVASNVATLKINPVKPTNLRVTNTVP